MNGEEGYINQNYEYDKHPENMVAYCNSEVFKGWFDISNKIRFAVNTNRIITVDTYPGTDDKRIVAEISSIVNPNTIINSEDIFYDEKKLTELMSPHLTDDRVRGRMYYGDIFDFIDKERG